MDWLHTFAGFSVGTIVGMTGVGGGALMTPILVLLFGVAPALAVGTDLWFAAITKTVGGIVHQKHGGVDWQVLRRLSLGSLPAAILTLVWLNMTGISQIREGLILNALGVVLLLTAAAMVFRHKTRHLGVALQQQEPARLRQAQPYLTVVAGALLGFLVTLTSVGGGALGIVMLVFLYPVRLKASRLVGTDIVHAVPLTIVAGTGYLLMGNVDFLLLGNLLLGSIPGIVIGSMLSRFVPEGLLRVAIAVILSLVGAKLILN